MQAIVRRWQLLALGAVSLGLGVGAHPVAQVGRRPSQGQAAWQFLQSVLRADYQAAYSRLAPEVRQSVSLSYFETLARPLWKSGQRRGTDIELYKLGMRLGERNTSRLFYSFSFAADSGRKPPTELLEVTFRDTAARVVLSFGLRTAVPTRKAPPGSRR